MTTAITFVRIEIVEASDVSKCCGYTHRLLGTYSDGRRTYLGDVKSEKGAKMMLSRRANQFGLTVNKSKTAAERG